MPLRVFRENRSGEEIVQLAIRVGLLAFLLYWSFVLVQPFIPIFAWSVVLAVALYPALNWLSVHLGGRPKLAAAIITSVNLAIVIGPATWLGLGLIESLRSFAGQLDSGSLIVPSPPDSVKDWPIVGVQLYTLWDHASTNLRAALSEIAPHLKPLAVRQGRGIPYGRTAVQGGRVHPRLDQPQPAADREPRRRAPADGAGRLWPGRQRHRDRVCDPQGGRRQSADLEIFQRARRGQDGAGGLPRQRLHGLSGERRQLGTGPAQPEGRRVLPRSDASDAGVRHRRLRRHAVQGHSRQPLRNPGQQDLAQFRADPVQHQQYPQRRRPSDPCAGRGQWRDRA